MSEEKTLIEVFKEVSLLVKKMNKVRMCGVMLLLVYAFAKLSGIQDGMVITSTAQAISVLVFELGFPLVGLLIVVWSTFKIRKFKNRLYQSKADRDQLIDHHGL